MTAPTYGLTSAQADCARVIAAMTDFLGNSPTYDEIAAELCLSHSKSGVHRLVNDLIERGWIEVCHTERAPRWWPISGPRRALRLTRSPPPFPMCAIAITEAGREYLEQAA